VNISSGYRCATHNKNIGGATGSRHAKGQAADIYINGVQPIEIARYAEQIGILGIGLYETDKDGHFVHVDTRTTKSFWYGQSEESRTTFQEKVKPTPSASSTGETYRVRKSWEDSKSQVGAYSVLENAKKACDKAGKDYKVYNSKGEQVYYAKKQVSAPEMEKTEDKNFKPYLVKVDVAILNYRQGPGTNYRINGTVKRNQVYTIVQETDGWGKLKSGAGWICLDHVKKV
jgi:hypothetical protein